MSSYLVDFKTVKMVCRRWSQGQHYRHLGFSRTEWVSRSGVSRSRVNRPGVNRSGVNRSGVNRSGGDQVWGEQVWCEQIWCEQVWCDQVRCEQVWCEHLWCEHLWSEQVWVNRSGTKKASGTDAQKKASTTVVSSQRHGRVAGIDFLCSLPTNSILGPDSTVFPIHTGYRGYHDGIM